MGACVGCGAEAGVGGSSAWSNGGGVASGEEAACVSRSSAGREGTAIRTMSSTGWTGGSVASTAGTRPASPLSRRRIRIKQSQQFAVSHYLSWPADPAQVKTRRMFHVKHSVETGIVRRSALHPRSSGHNYLATASTPSAAPALPLHGRKASRPAPERGPDVMRQHVVTPGDVGEGANDEYPDHHNPRLPFITQPRHRRKGGAYWRTADWALPRPYVTSRQGELWKLFNGADQRIHGIVAPPNRGIRRESAMPAKEGSPPSFTDSASPVGDKGRALWWRPFASTVRSLGALRSPHLNWRGSHILGCLIPFGFTRRLA